MKTIFLIDYLPEYLMKKAISLEIIGVDEIAWDQQSALELLKISEEWSVAVLGGDVYSFIDEDIMPKYDNWYVNKKSDENIELYIQRSREAAHTYIKQYPAKPTDVFVVVFDAIVFMKPLYSDDDER